MINTARLLNTFKNLVTIDSPSFGERQICDYIKSELDKLDLTFYEDDCAARIGGNCGNLYSYIDGDIDLPPLLFCAHMDTVEPSRGKTMTVHDNGTITSDGTTVLGADDLAAIASYLEAYRVIKENGLPHRPLELLFAVAEEPYNIGIKAFDLSLLKSREAYVFDLSGPVGVAANQAPTLISFKITFSGRSAHAGFAPENGIHAIKAAAQTISQIKCGRVDDLTVNIGTITGGTANNIVPDKCTFTGEVRSFSDEHATAHADYIAGLAKKTAQGFGAVAEVEITKHITAYCTDTNHSVVKRFINSCKALGLAGSLCSTYGGSDNNHLVLHGIDGIVVATAMNDCHTTDEYTTVKELSNAANLALSLMLSKE